MKSLILAFFFSALAIAAPSSNRQIVGQFLKNGTTQLAIPLNIGNDQLVGRSTADVLTNKSMDGGSNTFTNLPVTTALTGQVPIANGGTNASSLTPHGVMVGDTMVTTVVGAAGTLFQGNGSSSDPTATASPVLGVNGTTAGTLGLATATGGGGTVTLANIGTSSANAYTFVLPTSLCGSGQVMASAGSSSTPWTCSSPLVSPMTTQGDLIYGGAAGAGTRLAGGTAGQVLVTNSSTGAPSWQWGAGATVSQTSTYNVPAAGSTVLLSSASFTVTLPDATLAANQHGKITLLHNGTSLANVYTIATTSAQTIGGVAGGSYALYTNGESLTIYSDGANWQIENHRTNNAWVSGSTSWSATSAYAFTVTSTSVGVGAVYSNNSCSFIVGASITSSTTLNASGTCAPSASGTLTLVSANGASPAPGTVTFSSKTTTGQPVKATVEQIDSFKARRMGSNVEIWVQYQANSASGATAGTGDYILFFPSNYFFDSATVMYMTAAIGNATAAPAASTKILCGEISTGATSGASMAAALIPYINDATSGLIGVRVEGMTYATGFVGTGVANGVSNLGFAAADFGLNLHCLIPMANWQP